MMWLKPPRGLAAALCSAMLAPALALANVEFPADPQAAAECAGPAKTLRDMYAAEDAAAVEASKKAGAIRFSDCGDDDRCRADLRRQHAYYSDLATMHFRKRDELSNERYEGERKCHATARANERKAEDATRRQQESLKKAYEAFEKAKEFHEQARAIYRKGQEATKFLSASDKERAGMLLKLAGEQVDDLARHVLDAAYSKRNNAHSEPLDKALIAAKGEILNRAPRSPLVAAIQDASFDRLKSQVQQLYGDMETLVAAMDRIDTGPSSQSPSKDPAPVALPRRGNTSGSEMLSQAIVDAKQAEKERREPPLPERRAPERRPEPSRPLSNPSPQAVPSNPASTRTSSALHPDDDVCEAERHQANAHPGRRGDPHSRPLKRRELENEIRDSLRNGYFLSLHPKVNGGRRQSVAEKYRDPVNDVQALAHWAASLEQIIRDGGEPGDYGSWRADRPYFLCWILARKATLERR